MATKPKVAEPVEAPPAPEPDPLRAVLDAVLAGAPHVNEDGEHTGISAMTVKEFEALKKFAMANPPDHMSPDDVRVELNQMASRTDIRLIDR